MAVAIRSPRSNCSSANAQEPGVGAAMHASPGPTISGRAAGGNVRSETFHRPLRRRGRSAITAGVHVGLTPRRSPNRSRAEVPTVADVDDTYAEAFRSIYAELLI